MSGRNNRKTSAAAAGKGKRDPWLQKELETLLDQIIINKEVFVGKHAHNVSQIDKQNMWKEITNAIHQEHPECSEKSLDVVKKKWQNFTTAARTAIRNYNSGLTETGGGPLGSNGVLSPLYYKYYEQILGLDNPSVAATAIPGAVDTDDSLTRNENNQLVIMQHVLGIPCSSTVANGYLAIGSNIPHEEESIEFGDLTGIHQNEQEDGSGNEESTEGTPLPTTPILGQLAIGDGSDTVYFSSAEPSQVINKGKSLIKKIPIAVKRSHSTPVPSTSPYVETPKSVTRSNSTDSSADLIPPSATSAFLNLKKKRDSLTLRQTMKKAKFSVFNSADSSAKSRLTEARLRVLTSVMTVREMLDEPLSKNEIPQDLLDVLYNVEENV